MKHKIENKQGAKKEAKQVTLSVGRRSILNREAVQYECRPGGAERWFGKDRRRYNFQKGKHIEKERRVWVTTVSII